MASNMYPYEVLQLTDEKVCIKINPKAYTISVFSMQKSLADYSIAFTANYYWLKFAIGLLRDEKHVINIWPLAGRPVLSLSSSGAELTATDELSIDVKKAYVQAGPTLIRDGLIDIRTVQENFRADAVRLTKQISVGVTASQKLIVLYTAKTPLKEIAKILHDVGCVDAMKMDGGSSAFLHFLPDPTDKRYKSVERGRSAPYPTGLAFTRKQK